MIDQRDTRPLRAHSWWPIGIIAFFVVLAVFQAVVLYIGLAHKNALIEDQPYERGLAYQRVIDATSRVKGLGMNLEFSAAPAAADGMRRCAITITARDALPAFAGGAAVLFRRPSAEAPDIQAVLQREGDEGRFTGSLPLREAGLWLLEVSVAAEGKDYLFKEQIMLP